MPALLQKITDNPRFKPQDIRVIERAYAMAERAHHGQKRQSGEDYIIHPLHVAYFLASMGLDTPTIAAALLHDTLEDTPVTHSEMEKEFGKEITFLVDGVTKLNVITYAGNPGGIGTDPKLSSLKKMFFAMAEDIRVILIKLADRYHNMETLAYQGPEAQKRIALETLEIYAPIADRLGMGNLKGQLEDLCFPYVYPDEYRTLVRTVKEKYADRLKYIERTKPVIQRHLKDAGIPVIDIHSRAKRYYSLWGKLRRFEEDVEKVVDLVAMRIVVPDIKSCYEALGVIHKYYRPLPGKIKDYIALPKPNGYRSIHTTVFCEKGRIAEIQIRTPEMHDHAENGVAAHWAYSETGKRKPAVADQAELQWVNQLKNFLKEIKTDEGLKNIIKIDFFKHRIFVFTPLGDIKDLPEGATPIDFAYAIHTDLGHSISGARVNNKMVPLDHELRNADVVDVIKNKNGKPSLDWLKIAKTAQAKRLIKTWFKNNDPTITISDGKRLLDKELAAVGTSVEKLGRQKVNEILRIFSAKTMELVLIRVSMGDLNPADVVKNAFRKERESKVQSQKSKAVPKPKPLTPNRLTPAINGLVIDGQNGLLYKLGKCCAPGQGQAVKGYVTRAKGVTVHLISCSNLKNADKDRVLSATWT